MRISARKFILALIYCPLAIAQTDDPGSATIPAKPLEEWLASNQQSKFKWSVRVSPPYLSIHQRLAVHVVVQLEGRDLVHRVGSNHALAIIEFIDPAGQVFHNVGVLDLDQYRKFPGLESVFYSTDVFLMPGNYRFTAAVYDLATKEYSLEKQSVRVMPVSHDPLPHAWNGLPTVEFLPPRKNPPDNWYLPEIHSRLQLSVESRHPVRIEILMNQSATERTDPSPASVKAVRLERTYNRNLSALVPLLKIFSQLDPRSGSVNIASLDLERRKVAFEQRCFQKLDWDRLRAAISGSDPNKIDIHALQSREQNPQFFVSQVRQRIAPIEGEIPSSPRAIIVLSGPMAFPEGADLRPIDAIASDSVRVFYFRCYAIPFMPGLGPPHPRPSTRGPIPDPRIIPITRQTSDMLLNTLKPLNPRLFNIYTPDDFRKALASVLNEISKI